MKNLSKKLLAFVLVIALVFGGSVFSFGSDMISEDSGDAQESVAEDVAVSEESSESAESEAEEELTEEEPAEEESEAETTAVEPESEAETTIAEPESEAETETEIKAAAKAETSEMTLLASAGVSKGTEVTGTFDAVSGMDITTIRYYTDENRTEYAFADYVENEGTYTYTFSAPYDGFVASETTQTCIGKEDTNDATIVAAYYTLGEWDGAVDVSWYDASASEYHIYYPAQLAGVAAITNGSIDSDIEDYNVKGTRSAGRMLPDCIQNEHVESTSLGGPVSGPCYLGVVDYDFRDKTIYLEADMYMGGSSDGAALDNENIYESKVNLHDGDHDGYAYYPNWTPIGGVFLTDVDDLDTCVKAYFNGVFDGQGHNIYDLYCYRWSYPKEGTTAYGYAESTGFIGLMGYLYDESEPQPTLAPAIRNLGLYGFIIGRRSVGGILGKGSGDLNESSFYLENLANHATVYSTDSKGVGGIVGTMWHDNCYIINCYNTGIIRQCEYAAPAGGIIGQNNGTNIYCCYNIGTVSSTTKRGRGIGADDGGKNYTVDKCFYLDGKYDCNVEEYYGYYYEGAPSSVQILGVTRLTAARMTDGTMLAELNSNGTAYVAGSDGYPILLWEAGAGSASFTIGEAEGGSVSASEPEGTYTAGKILYLNNTSDEGWSFRYYTLNYGTITADYVTLGDSQSVVSGYFQSSGVGYIEIPNNAVCDITVYRVTGNDSDGYVKTELKNGDAVTEDDVITIEASIRDGVVPSNLDYEYCATAGLDNPFVYMITYYGYDPEEDSYIKTFTVSDKISGENSYVTVCVTALQTEKRWKYQGVTDWYKEDQDTFTITTPNQLAGLDLLVEDGNDFSGKTVILGNDISLANQDVTGGNRYWDGIGNVENAFAGTFDGAGYKITDMKGCMYGLFARCVGASRTAKCKIKNVSVYGTNYGTNACGIAGYMLYTDIENCNNYCVIDGTDVSGTAYIGGIAAQVTQYCTIKNCVNYGSVSGKSNVGGIMGFSSTTGTDAPAITDCINQGTITCTSAASGTTTAGGIAGVTYGSATRCANYADIESALLYTGGLVGYTRSSGSTTSAVITDSYNVGNVSYVGTNTAAGVGGLIGWASRFKVTNSFNYGTVDAGSSTLSGSFAGKYSKNSYDSTTDMYCLDDGTGYILQNMTYEELQDYIEKNSADDIAGVMTADKAAFASSAGVLAKINDNSVFVLSGVYPEFSSVASLHVHSGGTATCSTQAVCDECGLHYGELDPDNHEESELRNVVTAEWMQDGYTGDTYCSGCGELIEEGETIPVDTTKEIISVKVVSGEETISEKTYTVAEFDALKSTDIAGYQYGSGFKTIVATNRYVTIENLLKDRGYTTDELESVYIKTEGSYADLTREELLNNNLYVNEDGTTGTTPASIAMYYNTGNGTVTDLEAVAAESVYGPLRLLTGVSATDIENGTVGGFRLISPVTEVTFTISSQYALGDVDMNGTIDANDITILCKHVARIAIITDSYNLTLCDTNRDGVINADDITQLCKYVARIIDEL